MTENFQTINVNQLKGSVISSTASGTPVKIVTVGPDAALQQSKRQSGIQQQIVYQNAPISGGSGVLVPVQQVVQHVQVSGTSPAQTVTVIKVMPPLQHMVAPATPIKSIVIPASKASTGAVTATQAGGFIVNNSQASVVPDKPVSLASNTSDHVHAADQLVYISQGDLELQAVLQKETELDKQGQTATTTQISDLENLISQTTANTTNSTQTSQAAAPEPTVYCVSCNENYPSSTGCCLHKTSYSIVPDSPVLSRARQSVPPPMTLRSGTRKDNTTTVWSKEQIEKGTRFGPVVGVTSDTKGESSGDGIDKASTWQLFDQTDVDSIILCQDEEHSNWTMFLRPARVSSQQNLVAFQQDGAIYFVTSKDVPAGQELMYWYSKDYANKMGLSIRPEDCYVCTVCLKRYGDQAALKKHYRYIHPDWTDRRYKCNQCQKSFRSSSKLNTHVLGHLGVKPHTCTVCSKSFTDASNLRLHMSIHTGEKKHHCTSCQRSFRLKAHLTTHMLIHTGEKKLHCIYCQRGFARSSDLRKHEMIHTKETVFPCPTCKKEFYRKQSLQKHLKVHTGIKEYICRKCNKAFSVKYHMQRHELKCAGPKSVGVGRARSKPTAKHTGENVIVVGMVDEHTRESAEEAQRDTEEYFRITVQKTASGETEHRESRVRHKLVVEEETQAAAESKKHVSHQMNKAESLNSNTAETEVVSSGGNNTSDSKTQCQAPIDQGNITMDDVTSSQIQSLGPAGASLHVQGHPILQQVLQGDITGPITTVANLDELHVHIS